MDALRNVTLPQVLYSPQSPRLTCRTHRTVAYFTPLSKAFYSFRLMRWSEEPACSSYGVLQPGRIKANALNIDYGQQAAWDLSTPNLQSAINFRGLAGGGAQGMQVCTMLHRPSIDAKDDAHDAASITVAHQASVWTGRSGASRSVRTSHQFSHQELKRSRTGFLDILIRVHNAVLSRGSASQPIAPSSGGILPDHTSF